MKLTLARETSSSLALVASLALPVLIALGCGEPAIDLDASAHPDAGRTLVDGGAEDDAPGADVGPVDAARSDAGPFVPPSCEGGSTDRPLGAPTLPLGEWVDISPPEVPFDSGSFTQGMTIDPCNPATLYACVVGFEPSAVPFNGIYRSLDAGGSWERIGHLDFPINVRVDPGDPLHLYATDGVNGTTHGFFVSHDGGDTWVMPPSFRELASTQLAYDSYHVDADPTDFDHILVTFHNGWSAPEYGGNSGIIESDDGGETWTIHAAPNPDWAGGYDAFFLFDPAHGIGDRNTWLFGTQGDGYWRTTDAGATWAKVTDVDMDHGGGALYYAPDGTLYAGGAPRALRSTDNGATWTELEPALFTAFLTITGDGTSLYTGGHFGGAVRTARIDADTEWSELGGDPEDFRDAGPFEMVIDHANHILYSAHTGAGVWARRLEDR